MGLLQPQIRLMGSIQLLIRRLNIPRRMETQILKLTNIPRSTNRLLLANGQMWTPGWHATTLPFSK